MQVRTRYMLSGLQDPVGLFVPDEKIKSLAPSEASTKLPSWSRFVVYGMVYLYMLFLSFYTLVYCLKFEREQREGWLGASSISAALKVSKVSTEFILD